MCCNCFLHNFTKLKGGQSKQEHKEVMEAFAMPKGGGLESEPVLCDRDLHISSHAVLTYSKRLLSRVWESRQGITWEYFPDPEKHLSYSLYHQEGL